MNDSFVLEKDHIIVRESARMAQELPVQDWTLKEKVALTCRILFNRGHDSGLAGQITARAGSDLFVTQRLGQGFDEITVSNLLTVDKNLSVIDGNGMPNPANRFHAWIYRARPDVNCVVHTHPLHTSALSMLDTPLVLAHMDACALHDEVAFLRDWPGVPVGNEEGELICAALGRKRALLLAHHGLLVACTSVEEACVLAIQFERVAQLQLLAASAGTIRSIDPGLAREAHDWLLQGPRTSATFAYYSRQVLRGDTDCLQ